MRKQEFIAAINKCRPILLKRFYLMAKEAGIAEDLRCFSEDMTSITTSLAYEKSLREELRNYNCEALIHLTAKNIWMEFCRNSHKRIESADRVPLSPDWPEDKSIVETDERLQWLLDNADEKTADMIRLRLDGYKNREISELYDCTPEAISMRIKRLAVKLFGL